MLKVLTAAFFLLTAVIYVFCSFLETELKKSTGVELEEEIKKHIENDF